MTNQNCSYEEYINLMTVIVPEQYPHMKPVSTKSLLVDYEIIKDFTFEDVLMAYNAHRADPKHGMFCPTPAHLLKHLSEDSAMPTHSEIIAIATEKNTPLGLLCCMKFSQNDWLNSNFYDKKYLADSILLNLRDWKNKFYSGDFKGLAKSLGFHETRLHMLEKRFEELNLVKSHFDQPGLPRPLVQVAQLESRQTSQPKIPSQILDMTEKKRATL